MNNDLERYLNDHLAGSCGAVSLIQDLADRQEFDSDRAFFLKLRESVEEDQTLLKQLLDRGGMDESKAMQVAGTLTAKAGRLKLLWEGLKPGELGMFEALEILALGIQGKRMLWVMLREIAAQVPGWQKFNFADLELEAVRQRDAVDDRRLEAGRDSFATAVASTS